jgi:predicted transport protein
MVSFDDHVAYAELPIRPVLHELRSRINALDTFGRAIKEGVTPKQRITYRVDHIFVELKVQKKRILIRFFRTGVADPRNLVKDIPDTHGWQHENEIAIDSLDQIDYAMKFIESSYLSPRATM